MSDAVHLLTIFGGVALIVFGMRYLRKGLDRLFGQRLGTWMQRLGSRRGWAFLAGIGASVLAPSSTTMSLLAVQTVQAGQLTARQMLAIVLGANVGLTIMVLLIGANVQKVAPIILLVGVVLFQFTRSNRSRGAGQVVLAIAFMLMAIDIMERAGAALDGESGFMKVFNLEELTRHPFLLASLAAMMAMLLQSSTATIGLVIGVASSPEVTFRLGVPVVIGANVGLAITTLVVGWRLLEARRLALGNLLLKSTIAAVVLLSVSLLGRRIPDFQPPALGLAIAGVHTGFNLLVAAVGLPLVGPVTDLAKRVVPPPPPGRRVFGPMYISAGPIGSVALAMGQSQREITHMSEIIRSMLQDAWQALRTNDDALAREVAARDDEVDLLESEIKRFLTRLARDVEGEFDADEQMRQLRYLSELETIGDIVDKNLSELVVKKVRIGAEFSREGAAELEGFYRMVAENVVIAETAFSTRDRILAQQLLRHKERVDQLERELRDRHFARLNAGLAESYETSAIHLDLLTHLKRINSCVTHVAYAILQDTRPPPPPAPAMPAPATPGPAAAAPPPGSAPAPPSAPAPRDDRPIEARQPSSSRTASSTS